MAPTFRQGDRVIDLITKTPGTVRTVALHFCGEPYYAIQRDNEEAWHSVKGSSLRGEKQYRYAYLFDQLK